MQKRTPHFREYSNLTYILFYTISLNDRNIKFFNHITVTTLQCRFDQC